MSQTTLETAWTAFRRFETGWKTGDFQPYLAMLTDEFTFWFPVGKHKGRFAGREGKAQMIAKCHDHAQAGERLTFAAPHLVTSNDKTVVFQVHVEGTAGGEAVKGCIAISIDVSGEKISGFREYFGEFD